MRVRAGRPGLPRVGQGGQVYPESECGQGIQFYPRGPGQEARSTRSVGREAWTNPGVWEGRPGLPKVQAGRPRLPMGPSAGREARSTSESGQGGQVYPKCDYGQGGHVYPWTPGRELRSTRGLRGRPGLPLVRERAGGQVYPMRPAREGKSTRIAGR